MRYLITGGSGYIGGRLIDDLSGRDETELIVIVDVNPPKRQWPKTQYVKGDVRDRNMTRDLLQQQVEPQLLGVYLQLQAQAPATGETFPAVVPPPPPDEGSHRGYAGQWAIFAVLWLFGYPVLVRRAAQRRAQGLGRGEPGSAQPSDGVLFSAAEP